MEKQFVPINYKTAVGKEICVTVTVEVKELLAQSDRQIKSQRRQDRRHLTEYIDSLTPTQQRRLELLFFTSLSYSQIAKLEGVSDKSVAESVAQALKKLRKKLDIK